MTDKSKPVSIRPDNFTEDSEQDRLLAMSCEEVVKYKATVESKRNARMQEDAECEGRVSYRVVPAGLIQALDTLAENEGRSRRLVVKCLLHQSVALLSAMKEIDEINRQYKEILTLHGRYGGLADLIEQIDNQQFRYHSERSARGEFRAAEKLLSYFGKRSRGLGIDSCVFLAVGLAWSVTTTQDGNLAGAAAEIYPCLVHFRQYVFERSVLIRAYKVIANSRVGCTDVKNDNGTAE